MAQVSKICLICLLLPLQALAESASNMLQVRLDNLQSFQASFEQETHNALGKLLQRSQGKLLIGQGGQFLIETQSPFPQTLVSNGQDFWSYDPDLYQVIIKTLSTDLNEVPILLFGRGDKQVLETYHILNFSSDDAVNFVLKPKAEDALFETLTLSFQGDLPISISLLDTLSQKTTLIFSDSELNTPIEASEFNFVIPAAIDVIDER